VVGSGSRRSSRASQTALSWRLFGATSPATGCRRSPASGRPAPPGPGRTRRRWNGAGSGRPGCTGGAGCGRWSRQRRGAPSSVRSAPDRGGPHTLRRPPVRGPIP
jgi:hypothetical protein